MKKLYKLWHELDDENHCLAIVANSIKQAKSLWRIEFDYIEWNTDWAQFTFWFKCKRLKEFDVSNTPLWPLDGRQAVLRWIYLYCDEVWCDKCWKHFWNSSLHDNWSIMCRDCIRE